MNKINKLQIEEMIALLKEVAESSSTEFGYGPDDPGACIHCQAISYNDHKDDCIIAKTKRFLNKIEGEKKD